TKRLHQAAQNREGDLRRTSDARSSQPVAIGLFKEVYDFAAGWRSRTMHNASRDVVRAASTIFPGLATNRHFDLTLEDRTPLGLVAMRGDLYIHVWKVHFSSF